MTDARIKSAYAILARRVETVAALVRRTALIAGAGRLAWVVGLPLLVAAVLESRLGLPSLVRLLVWPAGGLGGLWLAWRGLLRPLLHRLQLPAAALFIERHRPHLNSRLISALQLYPELERDQTPFDRQMLEATVLHAQESTGQEDFGRVVDTRPARRHGWAGLAVGLLWMGLIAADPAGIWGALVRFGTAWADVRDLARQLAGARIVIEPLDRRAYLRGSDVALRIGQEGFRSGQMDLYLREEGQAEWQRQPLEVGKDGRSSQVITNCQHTLLVYAAVGRLQSPPVKVIVTERPRIVKLSVEYTLPAYVRRAPVVQPRSDGHLKALYGSLVLLTVEANKPLEAVQLTGSFLKGPAPCSVGGNFAQGALRLEESRWLEDPRPAVEETYSLRLVDEYGYENEDATRAYSLVILKDQPPELVFVGLPGGGSREPHILEKNLEGVVLNVRGKDDYGITEVALHYRIESLETDQETDQGQRSFPLGMPRADLPQFNLGRVAQLGAKVGDRVVFWAEAEDAYDLEPAAGAHRIKTPVYRMAIVTEESIFRDIVYKDDWSAPWYDGLRVAAITKRNPPPRIAPVAEPAATVAPKLLDALPMLHGPRGRDRQVIRSYFESLSGSP